LKPSCVFNFVVYLFLIMASNSNKVAPAISDPQLREVVRERSKALFGNSDRLQVAVAVHQSEDGVVNATDLADDLGIVNNRIRAQLLALAEAGLLDPEPVGSGKRWYVRRASDFWALCQRLIEDWAKEVEQQDASPGGNRR
jgi:hypothetical protein